MSDECPYCGKEVEICHDDGYGMQEDGVFSDTCHECGKTFAYTTSISVDHDLTKADCLNGDEHQYEATKTFPRRYSKMRCNGCGDERPPTSEEAEVIFSSLKRTIVASPHDLVSGGHVKIILEGSKAPIYGGVCRHNVDYNAPELYWSLNPVLGDRIVIAKDGSDTFYPNILSVEAISE